MATMEFPEEEEAAHARLRSLARAAAELHRKGVFELLHDSDLGPNCAVFYRIDQLYQRGTITFEEAMTLNDIVRAVENLPILGNLRETAEAQFIQRAYDDLLQQEASPAAQTIAGVAQGSVEDQAEREAHESAARQYRRQVIRADLHGAVDGAAAGAAVHGVAGAVLGALTCGAAFSATELDRSRQRPAT